MGIERSFLSEIGIHSRKAKREDMSKLNIQQRRVGEITVLDMDGKVTIDGTSNALHACIRDLLQKGQDRILLNLAGVAYIDSSGLGELISCHVTLNKSGGQMKILHLTQRLRELMTITKLLTIFDVYEVESDAIDSFEHRSVDVGYGKATVSTGA
jgi:anti-sigma B factor antagonist